MNQQHVPLALAFKGGREYLHGTDIFNQINLLLVREMATKDAYVQHIAFRKLAKRSCYLVFDNDNVYVRDANLIADVKLLSPTTRASFVARILESNAPVTQRTLYDEDSIITAAILEDEHRRVFINSGSKYSTIEVIVAITKHLHNSLYAVEVGKWLFGQLDLEKALPSIYSHIAIETKSLIGNRFTVNGIFVDGDHLGDIRFIVGKG